MAEDLAGPLPMRMIGHMLGYPPEKDAEILGWADELVHAGSGPDCITGPVLEAFQNFCAYHFELLEEKKAERGDDLLSIWLDAEDCSGA